MVPRQTKKRGSRRKARAAGHPQPDDASRSTSPEARDGRRGPWKTTPPTAEDPTQGRERDAIDAQPHGAQDARLGRTHDRILEAYGEIRSGTPADRALRRVFREARDLGAAERGEVSDIVYGLIRTQALVDDRLGRALKALGKSVSAVEPPMLARLRVLTYLASEGRTTHEIEAVDRYAFRRFPGLFERITSGRLPAVRRTEAEEVAIACSLPIWIVDRLLRAFGPGRTREMGRALARRAPTTFRVNRARVSRDEVIERIAAEHGVEAAPTRLSPDGVILPETMDVKAWPLYASGLVELQDEGSHLVALATGARPRESVLDACAGAGGKTLALGAMMQGTGRLVALDPDPRKLEELKRRARRAGLTSHEILAGDLEALPSRFRGAFDRVLVDAPCTGSGIFRRHPDARWRITERDLDRSVEQQGRLIAAAVGALRPGGLLVYATCSILLEENEAVVEQVARIDPRVEPVPLALTWGSELARTLGASDMARIGPGPTEDGPDGFFVALMRRIG